MFMVVRSRVRGSEEFGQLDELPTKRFRHFLGGEQHDNAGGYSGGDYHSLEQRESHDCYHEVTSGLHSWYGGIEGARASWFNHDDWISQDDCGAGDTSMDESLDVPMELQTKALQFQLHQVKRRLGPASQRCADAFDRAIEDDGTTAHCEFEKARRLCNPFEPLGEGRAGGLNRMFINRSAIKLANINAMLGFSLTLSHQGDGPFLFVDLCGAPGGFSEYIIHQCRNDGALGCRGYGMSLVGDNEHGNGIEWKLSHMREAEGDFTIDHHVFAGADGTGDIYNWENVEALEQKMREDAVGLGVPEKAHLVVADGGFDAQRDSELQEELAQKIVVCQAAAGISVLRQGGTMVLKMFGFQTTTIRALMKHLFAAFDSIIVVKPISSRPASAERYAVFSGFRGIHFGFSPLSWRNKMFLADYGTKWSDEDKKKFERLFNYLDKFDQKMLNLNLKTCFSILSMMERKTRSLEAGEYDMDEERFPRKQHNIDIAAYKSAWGLHTYSEY